MPITTTFDYTGAVQTFVVPANITSVTIEAWGAQGGSAQNGGHGGKGGYAKGVLTVTPGETLSVYVGGQGAGVVANQQQAGGWNGGGYSWGQDSSGTFAASGGGASDVRQGGTALANRKIVAGGGGGGGYYSGTYYGGGHGGADIGQTAQGTYSSYTAATGGTQSAGGAAGTSSSYSQNGSLGQGGNQTANSGNWSACGGGGGYYGGGSGAAVGSGGGGGSNYVTGLTNTTSTQGVRTGHGRVVITYEDPPIPKSGSDTGTGAEGQTKSVFVENPAAKDFHLGSTDTLDVYNEPVVFDSPYSFDGSMQPVGDSGFDYSGFTAYDSAVPFDSPVLFDGGARLADTGLYDQAQAFDGPDAYDQGLDEERFGYTLTVAQAVAEGGSGLEAAVLTVRLTETDPGLEGTPTYNSATLDYADASTWYRGVDFVPAVETEIAVGYYSGEDSTGVEYRSPDVDYRSSDITYLAAVADEADALIVHQASSEAASGLDAELLVVALDVLESAALVDVGLQNGYYASSDVAVADDLELFWIPDGDLGTAVETETLHQAFVLGDVAVGAEADAFRATNTSDDVGTAQEGLEGAGVFGERIRFWFNDSAVGSEAASAPTATGVSSDAAAVLDLVWGRAYRLGEAAAGAEDTARAAEAASADAGGSADTQVMEASLLQHELAVMGVAWSHQAAFAEVEPVTVLVDSAVVVLSSSYDIATPADVVALGVAHTDVDYGAPLDALVLLFIWERTIAVGDTGGAAEAAALAVTALLGADLAANFEQFAVLARTQVQEVAVGGDASGTGISVRSEDTTGASDQGAVAAFAFVTDESVGLEGHFLAQAAFFWADTATAIEASALGAWSAHFDLGGTAAATERVGIAEGDVGAGVSSDVSPAAAVTSTELASVIDRLVRYLVAAHHAYGEGVLMPSGGVMELVGMTTSAPGGVMAPVGMEMSSLGEPSEMVAAEVGEFDTITNQPAPQVGTWSTQD